MLRTCLYTHFDDKTGYPTLTTIRHNGITIQKKIYFSNENKTIYDIQKTKSEISNLIQNIINKESPLVISDFKSHIKQFDIPLYRNECQVYDVHLPNTDNEHNINSIISTMDVMPIKEYQKILANAAITYEQIERNGITVGYLPTYPVWSQKTFSGRSKTSGFNIQGSTQEDDIMGHQMSEEDIFLHFDWISADLRVASLLADDDELTHAFDNTDPYELMVSKLNGEVSREDAKLFLLKSVNSMDTTGQVLWKMYPKLCRWITDCKDKISKGETLGTILDRKFNVGTSKNQLAVINGLMQGSVAHAMQRIIRPIYNQFSVKLIAEVHDSLIMHCRPDPLEIKNIIKSVSAIMLNPFQGILDTNPTFPLKISIGKKWKKWKLLEVHRKSGVEKVNI